MAEFHEPVQRNTVHNRPTDSMNAGDMLRLIYRTGTENPTAPPDRHSFRGGLNNVTEDEIRRDRANG